LRSGRLYARGAQDNKGQLMYALKAMEALIRRDALNCTVKVLLEGEEECGGTGTVGALPGLKDLLKAGILMVCDAQAVPSGSPTLTMGLRGMANLTVTLSGPVHDLHSGTHGGRAPNPATEMARLIATLHNPDGSVAVEGFYDKVRAPTDVERRLAMRSSATEETYRRQTGVLPVAGEKRFSHVERAGFRPSVDVNGIQSGYGGKGVKTIIPAKAIAKLTIRVVPDQDPSECLAAVISHLEKHAPAGLTLAITEQGASGGALRLNVDSPVATMAAQIMSNLFSQETVMLWEGASVPIVADLSGISGAEPLLAGFGSEEDNIHAVNESFSLSQFRGGYLYVAAFLAAQ